MTMIITTPAPTASHRTTGKRSTRTQIHDRILELAQHGPNDRHQIDALLEDWVHALLTDFDLGFMSMFKAHWPEDCDEEMAAREFREYVNNWLLGIRSPHSTVRQPSWPWPLTDVTPGRHGGTPEFEYDQSALARCGYCVGRTQGLPRAERRNLLSYFFEHELPHFVTAEYGDAYGDPRSELRLRKMADVIAANCRNRKRRRDAQNFRFAIADWEDDLAYLKERYYDNFHSFDWPTTAH